MTHPVVWLSLLLVVTSKYGDGNRRQQHRGGTRRAVRATTTITTSAAVAAVTVFVMVTTITTSFVLLRPQQLLRQPECWVPFRCTSSTGTTTTAYAWTYSTTVSKRKLRTHLPLSSSRTGSGSNDDFDDDVAGSYQRQAEQLRNEIEQFEQNKDNQNQMIQQQNDILRQQQQQFLDRYSAVVPILKPDGSTTVMEQCTFSPIIEATPTTIANSTNLTSYITTIESNLPLGIIIGEVDGRTPPLDTSTATTNTTTSDTDDLMGEQQFFGRPYIVIDDIATNSNGDISGLQIGDIIHACTACKVEMEFPTWQLLLGGIGRPKTNRYMHSIISSTISTGGDRRRTQSLLEETMNAIASNRLDPEQRPILLVIERRDK